MNLSPLQKARYQYSPKLPGMLRGGISEISVKRGLFFFIICGKNGIGALYFVKLQTVSTPEVQQNMSTGWTLRTR